ncbi:hypothetical protein ABPG72_022444 [Tetrahymena utriculariae]
MDFFSDSDLSDSAIDHNDKQFQGTQAPQVDGQERQQVNQQYSDEEEQKRDLIVQTKQDQTIQQEDKSKATLNKLEMRDPIQKIQQEIQNTSAGIGMLENNGQQQREQQKRSQIQVQVDSDKIANESKVLVIQTKNAQNQSQKEQLEQQLNQLLEDVEIEDPKQIPHEIEDVKIEIEKFLQKNQQKKASESKVRLDKLSEAQKKYDELLKLKEETLKDQEQTRNAQNKNQVKQLEKQLNQLLEDVEIEDPKQILQEIEDVKMEIEKLLQKNQQKKASDSKIRLDKLNEAQKKYQELLQLKDETLKDLGQTENVQNKKQEEQLENQLNLLLKDLELEDPKYILQEIEDVKIEIQKFLQKNQQKKATESKERLDNLSEAQKIYEQLQKLKEKTQLDQTAVKQKQLEDKLNEILQELDLQNPTVIQSEIEETQGEIEKFEKKGQKSKVAEKKETLEKLKDALKIVNELKDLVKQTENVQNEISEEQLEKQLNLLLEELDISDVKQLPQEIEDVKVEIEKFLQKNQQKNASESKKKLDKLSEAQKKYQELLQLKKNTQLDQSVVQKKQLEDKLNEILQELDLQDADADKIESEIQEAQGDIEKFEKKGQKNKVAEKKQILEKLFNAQNMVKELQDLIKQIESNQIQSQEVQLQNKLDQLLNDLEVCVQNLPVEIQESKDQIQKFINKNQQKNADQCKIKLEKLEEAQRIQEQLTNIKNIKNENEPQDLSHTETNQTENIIQQSSSQPQSEPNEIMKRFSLDSIRIDISLIPESSEKYLLEMLETCLNLQQSTPQTEQFGQALLNQIEKIQKRLKVEDQISSEISQGISNIKINIEQDRLEAVIDETDKLLKKIRPLNINEMKRLINEADIAAKLIEGQEIILLLGGTGAGKSTTIHFLAGSEMGIEQIQLQQGSMLQYIAPLKIKNRTLQKIKVGFSAISETRFITPVNINFKDLKMTQNGSIILCDSPGFGDTAGPEVDIANGLGIVNAIKQCKSVRPVILLSYKSIGDRGQGIKQLAHILVGLVQNIQDKLSSFSYLFSKFPENYNINSELINIKNSVDQNAEEKSDKAFVSLFEDMIDKTQKSCNKIDPINGSPSEILKVLIKEEGIQDPSSVFRFSITTNSYAAITDFTFKTQQQIISALNRSEYKLIEYKLDEIKFLIDILNQDSTKQAYEYCINYIKETIKKDYENATEQLTQQIQNNNKLDSNYLKQYKELISKFSQIQNLKKKHLGSNAISATDLIEELKLAVKKLSEVFDQEDIIQSSVIINLDNIKLISEYFTEVNQQYHEACSKVQKQIQKVFTSCKKALDIKNFDDFAEAIFQVKQYRKQFQNHIDAESISDELEKIKDTFNITIDQAVQDANEMLKYQQLKDEAVEKINEQISTIERAEKNQLLRQHIDYVKNKKDILYKSFLSHFETVSKKIEEILKKEVDQAFQQLEGLVNEMNQLRKIKGLESKTADIYYKCITEIQTLMQQIKRDVEQLLNEFHHDKKKVDFQKVYRSLNQLKCAQWMNDVNQGAYDQTVKYIAQELYKYSQFDIVQKLGEIDLSCKNFINIQVSSEFIKELESMILFEEYNPKLAENRETALQLFKQSVNFVFSQVKEFINLPQSQSILVNDQDQQKSDQINKEEMVNLEKNKSSKQEEYLRPKYTEKSQLIKLDGSKVEDFLNYINECCKTKYIRNEANVLLEQLKQFLVLYRESKNQQINSNYELILDLNEEDEKRKTQSALQLASIVQEIIDIQKYEQTSSFIKPDKLIQELKNKMQQYYVELSHDMNQPSTERQQQSKNINISKLLSHVDTVFGEVKFFNLYKSQQNAMNNEFKDQYKNILNAIEKNDFKQVQIDLMAIDDNPLNQKAMNQIKAQLQHQIENLLEQTKFEALSLGNQIEQEVIMRIIRRIDLVKKSLQSLEEYLEPSFKDQIKEQQEQTIKEIDFKISKYLESINALLKQADFFEVEEKREHITQILQLLANHSKDSKNRTSLDDLQKNLEDKVSEITKTKYEDEKDFIFHPPKQILEKLSKVAGRNLKYAECQVNLQQLLIDKVRNKIVEYSSSDQNLQSQKILQIETLMNLVPEGLKQTLQGQLDSTKQMSENKQNLFQQQLEFAKKSGDLGKIKEFLESCQKEKMLLFESQMKRMVQEDCQAVFNKFQDDMEKGRSKEGVQQAIKLLEYGKHFETDDKIKNHCEKASNSVKEEIKNKVINLKCIEKFENSDYYEKEYDLLLNLLQTIKDYKEQFLSDDFSKILDEFCSSLQNFFINVFKSFEEDLENDQVQNLEKDLEVIKKWENLVLKLKNDFQKVNNLSSSFQQIPKALSTIQDKTFGFKQCMDKVVNRLSQSKTDILNFNFVQDLDKNKYYQMIQKGLKVLKQSNEVKIDFKDTTFQPQCYENECIPTIKRKIEEEEQKVEEALKKDERQIQDKDYKQINNYYENIQCFKNNVNVENPQIKIEQHIEKINETIEKKIENIENCIDVEKVDIVAQNIILMKKHSENLHPFKKQISNKLDNFLKNKYFKDKETKAKKMAQLAAHLQEDETGYGASIIDESEVFKGVSISIFNETTQKHGIDYVIENLRGDELAKNKLKEMYKKFESEYQGIVQKNLVIIEKNDKTDKEIIDDLVAKVKCIASKRVGLRDGKVNWDAKVRQNLPSLIAHVFAIWTLLNTQYFKEVSDLENKQNYLFKPHAGQVISIFRLLGLGYTNDNLYNNLVQLGTGEGKSVILAITSIIFTLYDIDIYCACYSEYLSLRDYNSFVQLFNILGVTSNIKYGIFNKICEQIINENGQIRDLAVNYITNGFTERKGEINKGKEIKPKILLIDEVDVFFSQDFYGKLYNPIARIQDQCIIDLAEFIWKKRNNHLPLKTVQETDIYKQCITKFKNLSCIIDEAIKDMISDSRNFQHKYIVQNRQIGYQEQDGISFNITYGYKTLFAYFYEREQDTVSEEKLKENTFISVKCGSFSYSEIPFKFNCIVGVTGTLETLSVPEKNIVQNIYHITKDTYIPSVFGKNNRKFAQESDTRVENQDDYFKVLREQINTNLNICSGENQLRAVLVFFDSKQNLTKFYDSAELSDIKNDVEVITEELSTNNDKKQQLLKKATVSGQVTLLTSSFGRGTDFICRDQKVLNNGGIHVIQTFYSNKKSEEVQIMGRSARQGQPGSYGMVLLDSELENIICTDYEVQLKKMRDNNKFYEKLGEFRKKREDQEYDNRNKFIDQIKKDHEEGQKFVQAMINQDEKFIKEFLANKNKGANDIPDLIRILCLVDATGSMGPLLNKAKITVSEMFERSCLIIKQSGKNIPEDCFQLQFAVYRDYDQLEGILEYSPWTSKVDYLRQFLDTVKPQGGGDYEEAVEIGLQHANKENVNQALTAIILLADAPSKQMPSIQEYRGKYKGESYWKTTKYAQITDYKQEMQKLKDKNIPIHCFYLHTGAKSNFEEIAAFTGGKCEGLNIEAKDASDTLIKVVVEPILKNVGKQNGLGDDLYKEYLKLFDKSYK